MQQVSSYEKQALDFLKKSKTTMSIEEDEVVDRFPEEPRSTGLRLKYKVTMTREGKSYTFPFYDSIHNFEHQVKATEYDVLACLQNYEVPEGVIDFANELGYVIRTQDDYNRVERIKNACVEQYDAIKDLFCDNEQLLEELREIV